MQLLSCNMRLLCRALYMLSGLVGGGWTHYLADSMVLGVRIYAWWQIVVTVYGWYFENNKLIKSQMYDFIKCLFSLHVITFLPAAKYM